MIHIGDHIALPGGFVDGTVIDITLTTVKIRQSDNTITTVPPLTLVSGMSKLERIGGCRGTKGQEDDLF